MSTFGLLNRMCIDIRRSISPCKGYLIIIIMLSIVTPLRTIIIRHERLLHRIQSNVSMK